MAAPSNRAEEAEKIKMTIKTIWLESKKRYGAPKIHYLLLKRSICVSIKRVQRYMASMDIRSIVVKKFSYHKGSHSSLEKPNILNQDFTTTSINQKWCTDITYIHTIKDGWTYLACVMDLHSKKIIGYSYAKNMTAQLALNAIQNACLNVKDPAGIVVQSDLGSQYTSQLFEEYLKVKGMLHSFSKKGNPYDNAGIESFHSILKKEEVHHKKYIDFKAAESALFEFIEAWYNRKRIHGSVNYMTPQEAHQAAL